MQKLSIKQLNYLVRQSLQGIYPDVEINSLINLIYEKVVNLKKTDILLNEDRVLDTKTADQILQITQQLKQQIPIQYIFGSAYFYDLTLEVDPNVLIPRQETEELVDWIIRENNKPELRILDIGTGSGCIAIALAKNLPKATTDAMDVDPKTLEITTKNATKNGVTVNPLLCNILDEQPEVQPYDLIVSNPPYVLHSEKTKMHKNVLEHEPEKALFVPDDQSLIFYRKIADFAQKNLKNKGSLYFEINERKGTEIKELLSDSGFVNIILKKDINGKDRMIKATKP
jgi:release factor glutamine methyltransferase